jgi:hypothetical protein
MRLPIVLSLLVLVGFGNSALCQQSSSAAVPGKSDKIAYRIRFQRTLLYKRLADEAESAQKPKPYLRRILANRFALSDDDSASLQRMAIAYQAAIKPVHEQLMAVVKQYRARFPFGVVPPGADATPPPELAELQQQEDAVNQSGREFNQLSGRNNIPSLETTKAYGHFDFLPNLYRVGCAYTDNS